MNAINFATRLTATILHSEHTLADCATLYALAAGLHTAYEIATALQYQKGSNTTTTLHKLAKKQLIESYTWLDDGTPCYRLTPTGKKLITQHLRQALAKH